MDLYEDYFAGLMPDWMGAPGRTFARGVGHYLDAIRASYIRAANVRFDRFDTDYSGTLPERGADARICRHPFETEQSYRARIAARWQTKPWAGTSKGVLDDLVALGFDGEETYVVDGADGATYVGGALTMTPGWLEGVGEAYYSKFWIVTSASPWGIDAIGEVGATIGEEGQLIGFAAGTTTEHLTGLRRTAWELKSAHSIPAAAYFVHGGGTIGDDPLQIDGGTAVVRLPLAKFIGEQPPIGSPGLTIGAKPADANCAA